MLQAGAVLFNLKYEVVDLLSQKLKILLFLRILRKRIQHTKNLPIPINNPIDPPIVTLGKTVSPLHLHSAQAAQLTASLVLQMNGRVLCEQGAVVGPVEVEMPGGLAVVVVIGDEKAVGLDDEVLEVV